MTKPLSKWNTQEAKARARAGAVDGLGDAADRLLVWSQPEVPVDTGALKSTGVAMVDPGALEAGVAYDTDYAVRQHEELSYQHPNGGKAKYLEDPLKAHGQDLLKVIAAGVKRRLS